MHKSKKIKNIGVVVIGRNEGDRLKVCMRSLSLAQAHIVYVDSGSTDGSVEYVEALGFDVVSLDMSMPFSAARARNDGYRYLLSAYQEIEFIQFVDGDCEVDERWIDTARSYLLAHSKVVAVCGRRRERYPQKTIYNQLCDIEWDTPVGTAQATGGDFMCRAEALEQVNGFSPQVIAGEEPELCFRWRKKGWLIERLDAEMTLHDAAMFSVGQWWKRCERAGHAYAQGFSMHGNSDERYYRKEMIRIMGWCLLLLFPMTLALLVSPWALMLLGVYVLKVGHIYSKGLLGFGRYTTFIYAVSLVLGKFPEGKGVLGFYIKKILGRGFHIIEYKK